MEGQQLYDLKIDDKLFYHFFISVGIKDMYAVDRGKMFLKHGPLKFTNDEVKLMQQAALMSKDKLFKTTNKEALEMYDMSELSSSIGAMQIAAAANQCTIHHFSSDFEINDDYWEGFVERANNNKFERRKLLDAAINSRRFVSR